MLWKTITILFIILTVYVLLGAVIFHFLEESHEAGVKHYTKHAHLDFLSNNTCLSHEDLETFVKNVLDAYKKGVIATANFTSETNWDFYSSLFFSSTVVTTIGYGNIAPATLGGQIFCIFFALGGIPLCTVFMASIGQKLRYPITKLQKKMTVGRTQMVEKCIKVLLCVALGDIILIFIPSVMFTLVEGWHYGVSVYYSVITLTTIGFGDYVAGLKPAPHRGLYRVICGIWVMLGLAWVALIIGEVSGDLTNTIIVKEKKCKEKCTGISADVPTEKEGVEMIATNKNKL